LVGTAGDLGSGGSASRDLPLVDCDRRFDGRCRVGQEGEQIVGCLGGCAGGADDGAVVLLQDIE
jgi:hypothetical protein